ncbi:hypothetical protein SDC9_131260 [bioreactor metagenome]|uniref:Uncharacterized protein n=1 Tax=bioreactor metagenome TaxID=1076179 RepID=A0A645D4Q1_9ZZZZ
MALGQVPRDGQPDARPTAVATGRATPRHPVEPLEDALQVVGRQPLPGIGDLHHPLAGVRLAVHGDPATLGRRPDRVADQVGHHLGDAVGVGEHRGLAHLGDLQVDARIGGLRTQSVDHPLHHAAQIDQTQIEALGALLGPGQRAEVVGQPPQSAGLGGDQREVLAVRRHHPVDHRLELGVDHGQRGAHLVAHLAQQPGATLLGVGQSTGHHPQIVHQLGQLPGAGLGQLGSVLAGRQPLGGAAQRVHLTE